MSNKKEILASIIIIGNEVLSGRTKDIWQGKFNRVITPYVYSS